MSRPASEPAAGLLPIGRVSLSAADAESELSLAAPVFAEQHKRLWSTDHHELGKRADLSEIPLTQCHSITPSHSIQSDLQRGEWLL